MVHHRSEPAWLRTGDQETGYRALPVDTRKEWFEEAEAEAEASIPETTTLGRRVKKTRQEIAREKMESYLDAPDVDFMDLAQEDDEEASPSPGTSRTSGSDPLPVQKRPVGRPRKGAEQRPVTTGAGSGRPPAQKSQRGRPPKSGRPKESSATAKGKGKDPARHVSDSDAEVQVSSNLTVQSTNKPKRRRHKSTVSETQSDRRGLETSPQDTANDDGGFAMLPSDGGGPEEERPAVRATAESPRQSSSEVGHTPSPHETTEDDGRLTDSPERQRSAGRGGAEPSEEGGPTVDQTTSPQGTVDDDGRFGALSSDAGGSERGRSPERVSSESSEEGGQATSPRETAGGDGEPAIPSSSADPVTERSSGQDGMAMSSILTHIKLTESTTDLISARHRDGTEDARTRAEGGEYSRRSQPGSINPPNTMFYEDTLSWDTLGVNPVYLR